MWFFGCFFFPSSIRESPLSLLRFKFTEMSVSSMLVFPLFFIFVNDNDDFIVVVVLVVAVVVSVVVGCFSVGAFVVFIVVLVDDDFVVSVVSVAVVEVSVVVSWFSVDAFVVFEGDFSFFSLVTWVHHSSSLSGWSPVSGFGLPLVGGIIFVVVATVGVVVVVVAVGGVNVVLVVF